MHREIIRRHLVDCIEGGRLRKVFGQEQVELICGELVAQLEREMVNCAGEEQLRLLISTLLGRLGPPITQMELFVTFNCNLRCSYCFVEKKNTQDRMGLSLAEKAVDLLVRESAGVKTLTLLFFGGEPLLEFGLIQRIIDYANSRYPEKDFHYSATTNGTLLTGPILQQCKDYRLNLLLSIDGDSEAHDRFRRTKNGKGSFGMVADKLTLLKEYQPWVGARMTVHPALVSRLSQGIEHLHSLGVNQFLISPAEGGDCAKQWSEELWTLYEHQLRKVRCFCSEVRDRGGHIRVSTLEECKPIDESKRLWGCRAARNTVAVSPTGNLYPCSRFIGMQDIRVGFKLGHVTSGMRAHGVRKSFLEFELACRKQCAECASAEYCIGGCPAINVEETGSIFIPAKTQCASAAMSKRLATIP